MARGNSCLVLITLVVLWCRIFEKTVLAKDTFLKRSWGDHDFFKNNDELSDLRGTVERTPTEGEEESAPIYLCRENSSSCVFIVKRGHSSTEDMNDGQEVDDDEVGRETEEHVDGYREFSEENRPIRLYNGTILGKKPLEDYSSLPGYDWSDVDDDNQQHVTHTSNSSSYNNNDNNADEIMSTQLRKKILAIDTSEHMEHNNVEDSSDQSRIIAYTIRPSTTNGTNIPTITLAQLARSLIFPDWLWSRFAANRRKTGISGLSDTKLTNTKGAKVPLVKPQLPQLTFDNNISRFLKLFTLVRFDNSQCASAGLNGTCYTSRQCTDLGGTAASQCANGFGVCCVFQVRCNGRTRRNGTYFVDTGVVFPASQVQTCNVQILKTTPAVKQMRLDFQIFSLRQPVAGSCEVDRLIVSGQDTNNIIPILCGTNTGSHIYIETAGTSEGIQLSIMTTGEGVRSWTIQVTQFDTINTSRAPTHCLQYYEGVMGTIQSFNYITNASPQYLNNLNYAICIRRESGFCSLTYTNVGPDGTYQPFQIVNANSEGSLIIPSGQAGVGVRDCPYDWIFINGFRLCGERLNDATTNTVFVEDAPVTDTSNGPFIVGVRTNEIDVGGGFNLYFRQNPCMSAPG